MTRTWTEGMHFAFKATKYHLLTQDEHGCDGGWNVDLELRTIEGADQWCATVTRTHRCKSPDPRAKRQGLPKVATGQADLEAAKSAVEGALQGWRDAIAHHQELKRKPGDAVVEKKHELFVEFEGGMANKMAGPCEVCGSEIAIGEGTIRKMNMAKRGIRHTSDAWWITLCSDECRTAHLKVIDVLNGVEGGQELRMKTNHGVSVGEEINYRDMWWVTVTAVTKVNDWTWLVTAVTVDRMDIKVVRG